MVLNLFKSYCCCFQEMPSVAKRRGEDKTWLAIRLPTNETAAPLFPHNVFGINIIAENYICLPSGLWREQLPKIGLDVSESRQSVRGQRRIIDGLMRDVSLTMWERMKDKKWERKSERERERERGMQLDKLAKCQAMIDGVLDVVNQLIKFF